MVTPIELLTTDPRPDLVGDRDLWAALLPLAHGYSQDDLGLLGALHGFRCLGAHLARLQGRMVLERGEISAEEYASLREQYLVPRAREVAELLQRLGEVTRGRAVDSV